MKDGHQLAMSALVGYQNAAGVAVVTLDQPPVNALSLELRKQLLAALDRADRDGDARAVVLRGAGRGFSAGADLREFGTPALTAQPSLIWHVHPAIEAMRKPVVAALHGMAIGGGLETALACHARVAAENTLIGLPEVTLGVIPLVGTQRLPRLLPLDRAMDLMLSGSMRVAGEFAGTPLFDEITRPAELEQRAVRLALAAAEKGPPFPCTSRLSMSHPRTQEVLDEIAQRLQAQGGGTHAQRELLRAVALAATAPDFGAGLERANSICQALLASAGRAKRRG